MPKIPVLLRWSSSDHPTKCADAQEFPKSDKEEPYAQVVELLRTRPKLSCRERGELKRLLSQLSANELLALHADPNRAEVLRRLGLLKEGGRDAWLVASAVVLLGILLLLVIFSTISDGILSWEDQDPIVELGSWHG